MKATTLLSTVTGALLISAIALAGSDSKQVQSPKPATHQMSKAVAKTGQKQVTSASSKKQTKTAMKQPKQTQKKVATVATKAPTTKTAMGHRIHHVKHQPKKSESQKQTQKKS